MTEDEAGKVAKEVVRKAFLNHKFLMELVGKDAEEVFTTALLEATKKTAREVLETINKLDALGTDCDWEDADAIAYAVRGFIYKKLKEKFGV